MTYRYTVQACTDSQPRHGNWEVYDTETKKPHSSGLSNSEAWRIADRLNMEPTSKQEHITDWLWSERVKG